MPDAEKIIAAALQTVSDTSRTASVVAAALREAGMLTETEWEYVCNNDEYRRFTDSLESARRWEDRGYTIRRRRAPSPAGPWEPVPTEGVSE